MTTEFRTGLTEVHVRELTVMADIGVHSHEIGRPQPLILDVRLTVQAVDEDRVEAVFDYSRIPAMAVALGRTRIGLIEVFARRMAENCLAHPLVDTVTVKIDKPCALECGLAGVTVMLTRSA